MSQAPPPSRSAVSHDGEVITQAQIEASITRISDEMQALVDQLAKDAEAAARAEVAWKKARAMTRIQTRAMGGDGPGGRATEAECDDAAMERHEDKFLAHRLTEGRYQATRDALFTKRTQIEALRTLAANVRSVTT